MEWNSEVPLSPIDAIRSRKLHEGGISHILEEPLDPSEKQWNTRLLRALCHWAKLKGRFIAAIQISNNARKMRIQPFGK